MAVAAEVTFWYMTEAELRQWVDAYPGRVNDRDWMGITPLFVAACHRKSLPLWLLDEKARM